MTQPKNPPTIIYLQWWDDEDQSAEDVTWCQDRINASDAVYVLAAPGGLRGTDDTNQPNGPGAGDVSARP